MGRDAKWPPFWFAFWSPFWSPCYVWRAFGPPFGNFLAICVNGSPIVPPFGPIFSRLMSMSKHGGGQKHNHCFGLPFGPLAREMWRAFGPPFGNFLAICVNGSPIVPPFGPIFSRLMSMSKHGGGQKHNHLKKRSLGSPFFRLMLKGLVPFILHHTDWAGTALINPKDKQK